MVLIDGSLKAFDENVRKEGFSSLAGIDEAGRGPLAGPVVAASCFIPHHIHIEGMNDSKLLTPAKRKSLYEYLTNHSEIHFFIAEIDVETIDRINILEATKMAMRQTMDNLSITPDLFLVDGVDLKSQRPKTRQVIKGDRQSQVIASASVLAKEYRDLLMIDLDEKYPGYGFSKHKGYGTKAHMEALQRLGPCKEHRKTFAPVAKLLL